ncbi:MAG: efflux transporter outer membrane subunit [Alistipes sp.]|nr:efflux transporter outer membrane subunit [Alistipes sp.]
MRQYIHFAILLALLASGCTPKLSAPDVRPPAHYIYGAGFRSDSIDIEDGWWRMFGDTVLNQLVDRALAQNRNLKVAVSRIEEARHNLRIVRSEYLPTFNVGISAGVSGGGGDTEQAYKLARDFSWEIPLFGQLRQSSEAARANIAYSEWQYRGVRLSLIAEVATTYFTMLQYRRDLEIARRSASLRRESATLIDSLFRRGMASGVNLEQAMNLVYTAEADIPLYERAVKQTALSMDVLLGEVPDSVLYTSSELQLITDYIPLDIPSGIPSEILSRRPDIMEAWYRMKQAAANAGLARTARLPSLSLTAGGGTASSDITQMFLKNSWLWNAGLSILQPVLHFGKLKRAERVAVEQYNQSVLSYEQSFLQALSEVESILVSISTYRKETERYKALVRSNARIALISNALYSNGLSAYLDVIDAERTLYNSQMQFSNIVAQQYINYINLCKALGGGWVEIPTNR